MDGVSFLKTQNSFLSFEQYCFPLNASFFLSFRRRLLSPRFSLRFVFPLVRCNSSSSSLFHRRSLCSLSFIFFVRLLSGSLVRTPTCTVIFLAPWTLKQRAPRTRRGTKLRWSVDGEESRASMENSFTDTAIHRCHCCLTPIRFETLFLVRFSKIENKNPLSESDSLVDLHLKAFICLLYCRAIVMYLFCCSYAHNVAPKGKYIAFVTSEAETDQPEVELKPGIDLLGPVDEIFYDIYDRYEPTNDHQADGCFISTSYDATTHFETTLKDVIEIYSKITGKVISFLIF
ncbi:hypothetical protein RIF29_20782 [Crotalaria pallida]|uniref:Guanosine nucleotide diphosphate dissociation inhibitor n=1 Tax=Crotalaria pallida TaxID=3830 RepID=A0AAN9F691_CROPI